MAASTFAKRKELPNTNKFVRNDRTDQSVLSPFSIIGTAPILNFVDTNGTDVAIQGDQGALILADELGRFVVVAPSVFKNGTFDPHIDFRAGQTYSAGLFTEQTGTILSYGINGIAQLLSRDNTRVGGLFRLDTRPGIGLNLGEQSFIIIGVPTGGSAEAARFICSLQNGNTLLNPVAGTTAIGRSAAGTAQMDILSLSGSRIGLIAEVPSGASANIAEFRNNSAQIASISPTGLIQTRAGNGSTPSSGFVSLGGTLEVITSLIGNVGAGEDNLQGFTVSANTLANNGDYLEIEISIFFAGTGNNKRVRVYYAGNLITGADTGSAVYQGYLIGKFTLLRDSSTTIRAIFTMDVGGSTLFHTVQAPSHSATHTNNNVFQVTGEATNDNDIIQISTIIKKFSNQ